MILGYFFDDGFSRLADGFGEQTLSARFK